MENDLALGVDREDLPPELDLRLDAGRPWKVFGAAEHRARRRDEEGREKPTRSRPPVTPPLSLVPQRQLRLHLTDGRYVTDEEIGSNEEIRPRHALHRTMAAVFAVILLGSTLGCRSDPLPRGVIVVALDSMPQNLDPRFATDAGSERIDHLVFRSLTRLDEHGQHVPDLAVDWRLEGPLAIVFRLRRDSVFQDGTPLRADDVRATYASILDPAAGSPKRDHLSFLAGVDAPDEWTVRFRLKKPFSPFLDATTIGIPSRAGLERRPPALLGAGPFRIAAVEPNQEVRLEAVAGHVGLTQIRFRVIPDDTVRALEVEKGTVQLVENAIEPENVDWLGRRSTACVERRRGTTFQYLGLKMGDPHLKDPRVRRAIAHAIDREGLVKHLLNGYARPATGLLSPGHWAYEGEVASYPHDLEAARRLLDEAGFLDADGPGPAVRFRLSYPTTTRDSRRRVAEAIQAMLAEIGIGLDVQSFEWGTFYDDIRRSSFQLYSLAWVGITDPDFFFGLLHSTMAPPRGNNRGGYADPEVDRLTLAGRESFSPEERQRIYSAIQKRAAAELPFIPLWWTDNVIVRDPRLCGFVPSPDGNLLSLTRAWWNEDGTPDGAGPCACVPER